MLLKLLVAILLNCSSAIPTFKLGVNTAAWENDEARAVHLAYKAFKDGATFIRELQDSWEDFDVEILDHDNKGSSGKAVKGAVEFWFSDTPVNAMIGCSWSSLSMAVGALGHTMQQVQMGYSSTNARLSNKLLYSYFLRTVPPDSLQSVALYKLVEYLKYTRVSWWYCNEPYAEGLYRGFVESNKGGAITIENAEPLSEQQEVFDGSLWIDGMTRIIQGSARVVLAAGNTKGALDINRFAMANGFFGPDRLLIQVESSAVIFNNDMLNDEEKVNARGSIGVMPVSKGSKFPQYVDFLKTTTKADLPPPYSTTLWDKFGWTEEIHATGKTYFFDPFLVDALTAYLICFNKLLKEGHAVTDIKGKLLLDTLKPLTFKGISGDNVFFNENGDRLADFEVWNIKGDGGMEVLGVWGDLTGVVLNKDLYFPDGTTNPTLQLPAKCPLGKARPTPNSECVACANGLVYNELTEDCQPCDAGKGLVNAAGEFMLPGESLRTEGVACNLCKEGFFSNKIQDKDGELRVCSACDAGETTEQIGQTQCTPCRKGFYSGEDDVLCQRCPIGRYTEKEGQTGCETCGKMLTTLFQGSDNAANCICQENYYLASGNESSCKSCPEGMTCKAGSDVRNFGKSLSEDQAYPTLNAQYWSSASDPLSVYRCNNHKVCPGGAPGDCHENTMGLMCSQCAPGWRRAGDSCVQCTDIETSKFLFPILPLILGPILVAVLYWRNRDTVDEWGAWNNGVAALFLLLLNHYQMVGLIRETKLQLTENVKDYWNVFTYLNGLMSILSPDCAGMADFKMSYVVGALLPLIVAAIFFETFTISILVSKFKPALRMDSDHTLNGFFSLLFAFYVAVCKGSIDVFLCDKHPNETRTLSRAPYVYCDSDDWQNMFGVGVFALVVFCLLTGAVFCYQLWIAPQVFQLPYFQKRWKFLVMKFRPDVWWWGVAWILKGLLMNLVLLGTTSFGQLTGLFLVTCMYLMATVTFYPWRHASANMSDRQICVSLQVVAFLALCNDSFQFESPEAATWCLVVSSSPMFVFACLCLSLVTQSSDRVQEWTKARYSLIGLHLQRSFAPLAELKQEDLNSVLVHITESDVAALVRAADVVMAEFCGQQARQSRLRQRLITSQKRIIQDCNVNGIAINRRVEHPTAETQFLHLDAALPASTAIDALLISTGLRDSHETLSQAATSVSEDMKSAKPDQEPTKQW